jgi:hypothetical protein
MKFKANKNIILYTDSGKIFLTLDEYEITRRFITDCHVVLNM